MGVRFATDSLGWGCFLFELRAFPLRSRFDVSILISFLTDIDINILMTKFNTCFKVFNKQCHRETFYLYYSIAGLPFEASKCFEHYFCRKMLNTLLLESCRLLSRALFDIIGI